MDKAQEWNHLAWTRWMTSYWIYWRNKFSENHLNPLNSKACSLLSNSQNIKHILKTPLHSAKWSKSAFIILLYLILLPLILITILPYITAKNCWNEIKSKKKGKNKWVECWYAAFASLFAICFVPIAICSLSYKSKRNKNEKEDQ